MRLLRHKQRAQITPFALFAALILTGAVALVVDAGVFFVTQRQLQTAADSAALAAVWYPNTCGFSRGCDSSLTPCNPGNPNYHQSDCVADAFALVNLGFVGKLCSSFDLHPPTTTAGRTINYGGGLNYYRMQIDCDAPYWFARVFPRFGATIHMSAVAVATIGFTDPVTGTLAATGNLPLITKLSL